MSAMRVADPCPECTKPIIKGEGLLGADLRCPDYPTCSFRIYIDQHTQEGEVVNRHESLFREALEKTRKKLLDLTRRNTLLAFKESQRTIRIVDELPNITFDFLIEQNKELELSPEPEKIISSNESNQQVNIFSSENVEDKEENNFELPIHNQEIEDKHKDKYLQTPFTARPLERRAKRLKQLFRSCLEETGSNMLYLAIGFLEFSEHDDSEITWRAPLILIPIQIERKQIDRRSNSYKYAILYTGEDITTNLSLAKKLSEDFDLVLPEFEENTTPESYFEKVTNMISDKKEWRVAREMIIGMFSFSKLLMYLDLDFYRWPKSSSLSDNENLRIVLVGSENQNAGNAINFGDEYNIDNDSRAKEIPLIVDADSSQHSALVDAVIESENLVIEGPPGTGKSQTITNIIGACLKQGKSILFISEKKAALDVVRRNLDKVNLGQFCLELHSYKTHKGRLHQDLKQRLERNNITETNNKELLSDLNREKDKLIEYSEIAKNIVGPNNDPIHEIFWTADRYFSEINGKLSSVTIREAQDIKRDIYKESINILEDYSKVLEEIPDNIISDWSGLFLENIIAGDESEIDKILENIIYITEAQTDFIQDNKNKYKLPITIELNEFYSVSNLDMDVINNYPNDLDPIIATIFLEKANIKLAEELHRDCQSYYDLIDKADSILGFSTELIKNNAKKINLSAKNLGELGYVKESPASIETDIPIINKIIEVFSDLPNCTDELAKIFQSDPVTINDYIELKEKIKIVDKCPKDFTINYHDNNLLEEASVTLNEASMRHEYLVNKLTEKANIFNTTKLPPYQDIADAIKILREHKDKLYKLLIAEYRNTKNYIKNLLSNKKAFKQEEFLEQLEEYRTILEQIDRFQENAIYHELLGKQYCGLNTNWQNLETHVIWCNKLREAIGSFKIARNVISENKNIKEYIKDISMYLNNAIDLLNKTKQKTKLDINTDLSINQFINNKNNHIRLLKANLEIFNIDDLNAIESTNQLKNTTIDNINISSCFLIEALDKKDYIDNKSEFRNTFYPMYNGVKTDTNKLLDHSNWLSEIHNQQVHNIELLSWIIHNISTDQFKYFINVKDEIDTYILKLDQLIKQLSKYGSIDKNDWLGDEKHKIFLENILKIIKGCRESIQYAQIWSDYCKLTKKIHEYGLDFIKLAIDDHVIDSKLAVSAYKSVLYRSMGRHLLNKYKYLGDFNHISYESTICRLKKLDNKLLNENTKLIAKELSKNELPIGIGYGKVRDFTEMSLIKHEINKKRAHVPIRQLVRKAGNSLKALKPCFMMSPMSVAQYLAPGQVEFDVLVIDEASQVRPHDALGAIARSKQMIIVGDANQLPPTDFFMRAEEEEDYEEETAISGIESILDISMTYFKKRRLRWHYRSEHESLINFSNSEFYDDDLMIFPSPKGNHKDYGVKHHYIDNATYLKGKNYIEAEFVVKKIIEHYQKYPELSLGVATFNIKQRDLISDLLEKVFKKEPWFDRKIKETEDTFEPFFIKNLENVQGDERDVIFISTTFGKDPNSGTVHQRFGPLGGDFGWRRLNVICTRAKKRIELCTSLRSGDIILGEKGNKGKQALKSYLYYAESGGRIKEVGIESGRGPDSDFEISVGREIQKYGYEVVSQVGVAGFYIDLAVKHPHLPGEYLLGIECDGATYHSAKSVRDRDIIRQEILESKGWKIHRVWSTDWFKNRDKEIERLISNIEKLLEEDKQIISDIEELEDNVLANILEKEEKKIDSSLEDILLEYKYSNIDPRYPDQNNGMLRDEMLSLFVKSMPTTRKEFQTNIPQTLREKTDTNQGQFLEDIFELIEEYDY